MKVYPNEKFTLDMEEKFNKEYKKEFFEKDLVKIVYLLNELDKSKYTKLF